MILLYAILAILSSWIWMNYFRVLVGDKDSHKGYAVVVFALGAGSYWLFNFADPILSRQLAIGELPNVADLLIKSFTRTALLSEVIKLIPVFLILLALRKKSVEPIEVVLFFAFTALGFSTSQTFYYSLSKPFFFFDENVILNTLGEMFCSVILANEWINYRFHQKHKKPLRLILVFLIVVFIHGFYDFWLTYEQNVILGYIVTVVLFFYLISFFATTITNALNHATNFSYQTIVGAKGTDRKMIRFYLILIVFQFILLAWGKYYLVTLENLGNTFLYAGLIVVVAVKRANKIKRIERRWTALDFELPFTLKKIDLFNGRTAKYKIQFKGETYNEEAIDAYEGVCSIVPLSHRNSFIVKSKLITMEKKIFLKNDETFYLISVVNPGDKDSHYLLKPKISGKKFVKRKYPIVALLSILDLSDIDNKKLSSHDFQFREWVFVKHR